MAGCRPADGPRLTATVVPRSRKRGRRENDFHDNPIRPPGRRSKPSGNLAATGKTNCAGSRAGYCSHDAPPCKSRLPRRGSSNHLPRGGRLEHPRERGRSGRPYATGAARPPGPAAGPMQRGALPFDRVPGRGFSHLERERAARADGRPAGRGGLRRRSPTSGRLPDHEAHVQAGAAGYVHQRVQAELSDLSPKQRVQARLREP